MASDDDDIPLLTRRLSEGMAGSSFSQQFTGNSVAFALLTYAHCFLNFTMLPQLFYFMFASLFLPYDTCA